jgi:DNA-binding NarL/FixJ family response regulator
MNRARILLADDHAVVCAGFQKLLEADYEVVGFVGDGRALIEAAMKSSPDLVILDIAMPLLNGLDAGRKLKALIPGVKILFLTMHSDSDIAKEALNLGALGYVLKTSLPSELLKAVAVVVKGGRYVTKHVREMLDEEMIRDPDAIHHTKHLTQRQREIVQLLAEGRSMKEVAYLLHITHRTVRFHKAQVMEEMGFHSNMDLLHYAIRQGMLPKP